MSCEQNTVATIAVEIRETHKTCEPNEGFPKQVLFVLLAFSRDFLISKKTSPCNLAEDSRISIG